MNPIGCDLFVVQLVDLLSVTKYDKSLVEKWGFFIGNYYLNSS
jgi:hypothetical protein